MQKFVNDLCPTNHINNDLLITKKSPHLLSNLFTSITRNFTILLSSIVAGTKVVRAETVSLYNGREKCCGKIRPVMCGKPDEMVV